MTDWMKSWDNFLTENKQPIEEASEEEIASLDKILLGLRYEDLSFNNLWRQNENSCPSRHRRH